MSASAGTVQAPQRVTLLDRPFLGTDLTVGGAIISVAAAPVLWFVIMLVWAALPA